MENEDKWVTYEDEETDVELELSDELFNFLIEEVVTEMFIIVHPGEAVPSLTDHIPAADQASRNIFGNVTVGGKLAKINKDCLGGVRPKREVCGFPEELPKQIKKKKLSIFKGGDGDAAISKESFMKSLREGSTKLASQIAAKDSSSALNSSF